MIFWKFKRQLIFPLRLERYLVQLIACNVSPIVVLNKVDMVEDWTKYTREIAKLQRDFPVYFCSTYTRVGLDEIRNNVPEKYKTYILIGSSGVGKSSLLNALMQTKLQEVNNTNLFHHKSHVVAIDTRVYSWIKPNGSCR